MPRLVSLLAVLLAVLLSSAPAFAQEWTVPAPTAPEPAERPPIPEGWETVHGTWLEVYGAPDAMPLLVELSRHGSASLPRMADTLAVPVGDTVFVYVASTPQDFRTLQPGDAPEWADATAYPALGAVFLRRPGLRGPDQRPLQVVLDHELVHVLLGRAFAPHRPPRWLQEGVAQVLAGEHDPSVVDRMAKGMLGGDLLTLEELTYGFPNDAARARLAYAQSADFVDWIRATHGHEALQVLVRELARGGDVRAAVRAATGQSLDEVDAAWRSRFTDGVPLWVAAFGSLDLWWGAAGLAAAVALVLAYRRRRRRMEAYARDEAARDALLSGWLDRRPQDSTRADDPTVH